MKAPNTFVALAFCAFLFPFSGHAQAYRGEKLAYLDATGNPAKEKKAVLLQQTIQFNDTLWEFNFYRMHGPRLKSFRCRDAQGNIFNGRFISYSSFGRADTIGEYSNGKRTGQWNIFSSQGRLTARQQYMDGELIWTKDTVQLQHDRDSVKASRKDTVKISGITKIEVESEFPGGASGWLQYLNKHLRYPDNALNYRIQGQVVIGFIVDTEGHIPESSVYVDKSVEYSLDEEALRMILNSPAWTPASRNGRLVKSYKKQPINFQFN